MWALFAGFAAADTILHLEYAASLSQVPIGEVSVRVHLTEEAGDQPGRYEIAGSARSIGLWETFQRWRAEYSASGAIADGAPVPSSYRLLQSTPRKTRDVRVANTQLHEIKNGRQREPRSPPPGLDVLAAFFVRPDCAATDAGMALHTGRYPYRLTRRAWAESGIDDASAERADDCLLSLLDVEDGDRYRLRLQLVELAGWRVPRALVVRVPFAARLVLRDWRVETGSR